MRIHFIGIKGVSMRLLAEIEKSFGNIITGSDLLLNGHSPENVKGADLVVYTAAVHKDNVELKTALQSGIPCVERAELLGRISNRYQNVIAVAGAHGKTTTTGMLWKIFDRFNPTIHIGGSVNGKNGQIGNREYFITEACEYNRSFLALKPDIGIILNMDWDHTDCYKTPEELYDAFKSFGNSAKKYVIVNGDEKVLDFDNKITFGFGTDNDYYCLNLKKTENGSKFDIYKRKKFFTSIELNVPGRHNVLNAIAAAACADIMNLNIMAVSEGLKNFCGTARRFDFRGYINGAKIYSDYAHHPKEIISTIETAREIKCGNLIIIFEPHTFTRTKSFFDEFIESLSKADEIIISDIYAAREDAISGINSVAIVRKLLNKGCKARYFSTYYEILTYLNGKISYLDTVIFMGAGDIDKAAEIIFDTEFYEHADKALCKLKSL